MTTPSSAPFEPRPVQPDGVTDEYLVWIKACSTLRLTNQLRLAVAAAAQAERRVLLVARSDCVFDDELASFITSTGLIEVRRSG